MIRLRCIGLPVACVYMPTVVSISFLLAFPGFGVLVLPQPFLEVARGRWGLAYDPIGLGTIPWIIYTAVSRCIFYDLLAKRWVNDFGVATVGGILFLVLNVSLVLAGLNADLRILLSNYAFSELAPLYWSSSCLVNVGVEIFAYRIARRFIYP